MIVYMVVTTDEYELPVAIGDTMTELARVANMKVRTIQSGFHNRRKKYIKVDIGDLNDEY